MRNLNICPWGQRGKLYELDYLPMRNLNVISCWDCVRCHCLIIFQWGIWICREQRASEIDLLLDYLPMRNLNILILSRPKLRFITLIIFQWGIWMCSTLRVEIIIGTWLSSNEEFEYFCIRFFINFSLSWLSSNEEFECVRRWGLR